MRLCRGVLAIALSTLAMSCGWLDVPPSGLTYSVNPAVYTVGTAISSNTPSNSGSAVFSYSVSPALPAGLSLDSFTGVIFGTPTAAAATAGYTVTASNPNGSTTVTLTITVNVESQAPAGLTYSVNPAVYTVGAAIGLNAPTSSGGPVASYSVSPALPAGLSLNTSTGVISGTPTAVAATASYTVTAVNSLGSTTVGLSITVNAASQAPAGLTYSVNPAIYTVGVTITPNVPSSSGGAVVSYSVSPSLPAGLSFDTVTGQISGTPSSASPAITYAVTATNADGSATAGLAITVSAGVLPPSGLTYSVNPAVYTTGTAISSNTPSSSGSAVVSYAVSPALPAGLSLNTSTGVISGTPSVDAATATYTVTATNSAGSTTVGLSVTVNAAVIAPSGLTYSVNPAVYTVGTAIPSNTPSSSGSAVVSYAVSPALPAGLSLNTSTGVISGTPSVDAATATYTVTATNSAGSTTVGLSVTVNAAVIAPSGLTYSVNPAVYTVGTAISSNTPSSSGSAVVSYSVSPGLPAGLSLNTSTGVISGTPSAAKATATYTVTARNSAGSTTVGLSITVNAAVIPPSGLTYSVNPAVYTVGTAISSNTPRSSGGTVVSYAVSPALPAGLSLNTSTGVISGTPSVASATAIYTVTATNSAGNTTVGLSITVNAAVIPPSGLTYSVNPAVYTVDTPISPNTPTSSGSAVVSYAVSPGLPAGLSLNTSTGVISGTPKKAAATRIYTVTATNSAGHTTVGLSITVNAAVIAPSGLTYSVNPAVYTVGTAISSNTPSSSGGAVVSYAVSPDLPAGLSLNTSTGVISGTPSADAAIAVYTVTATNSAGSTTVGLSITVNAAVIAPSGLSYSMNPAVYTVGTAISSNTPSSSGGAVVSYAVSPDLPAGLSLNTSTGVISGTPSVDAAIAVYTVTATNSAGSSTVELTVTVMPI